jgi:hypothetical protein
VMPPVEQGGEAPVFGGADMVGAFRDRPEIREFVRSVMSPEWGTLWAAHPSGVFLPFNAGFEVEQCRATELPEAVNEVRVRLCREARDGVADGLWRFDASDLMPRHIGAITEFGTPGAFLQGMLDYVEHGPDNVDQVLADIEAARLR